MTMPVNCPYCDHRAIRILETKDYNRRVSQDTFYYAKCTSCGLIFLEEIPADLARYYPLDYHNTPKDLTEISSAAERERYKIEIVNRFKTSGRLLEVGASYGAFCLLAKKAGFDVVAIEMDADCCQVLETVVGVSAVCSADAADAISSLEQNFDAVALWHSIEHIPQAWKVLDAAAKHLTPGGIVVIAAPNPAAFQFRLFEKYWTHIDAPRHLYMFPLDWFEARAKESGLRVTLRTTTDEGSVSWNGFGWQFSLANLVNIRIALRGVGKIMSLLLRPYEQVEGRGSCYTVVIQKDDKS